MEISEPTLLAKLPRAGTSEEGSRKFSQVYGLRDGRTKKRNEVCAAIDGNSMNVFEVVNGRNIASWPVPPDASFVSLPYSERKFVNNTNFVRRCWCAVRRKGQAAIHYYEQTNTGGTTSSGTSSVLLNSSTSAVIKIGHVSTSDRQIVVVQDDGSITCLSSEGGPSCRRFQLGQGSPISKFYAVQSLSLTDAQNSTLKGRPDISATLSNDSIVISAVYRDAQNADADPSGLVFGVWALTTDTTTTHRGSLLPIIKHRLQTSSQAVPHFKSGGSRLDLHTSGSIETLDLTAAAPQKLYERKLFAPETTSTIELSHDISMSCFSGELRLSNPKFGSLLASTRIGGAPLKRKRDGLGLTRMSFISYFSVLKRVLAYSGSQLLAIDIHIGDPTRDPFKQSSLLVGNILKGHVTHVEPQQIADIVADGPDLSSLSQKLDDLVMSQNVSEFERTLTVSLDLKQWEDMKKLKPQQTNLIISKMFALASEEEVSRMSLKLRILPMQLLKWCTKSGLLDDHTVSKALRGNYDMPPGVVADCFRQASEDLSMLEGYITDSPFIHPAALTRTIKSLIDLALTTTSETSTVDQISAGGIMDMDETADLQISSRAVASTQVSSPHARKCLAEALKRLAHAGSTTVSGQIRTILEQKEVLALIQFLRQQLFLGGYTRLAEVRNYPSPPPSQTGAEETSHNEGSKMALNSIVTLLNGCIDSLGIVGIIGSTEEQAFIERMIPELCSEIESATRAVEDSTYLHGLLRETLRYAESVERQPFETRNKVEKSTDALSKKGEVTTLYTEGEAMETRSQLPTVLPLNLRAEEDISKRKMRKGGQTQNRSKREMGMLKDRLKAPYAFERLVL